MASSFPATNPANWANTVFVAPRDATADINAVAAKFGAAGTVVGINAATPTNSSFLVEFASADAAKQAVDTFADVPFGAEEERGMRVRVALEPLEREVVPNAVYVRNVAREATKEEVGAIFAGIGEVIKVRPVSRRGGGMEVVFEDEASVAKAIALSGGSLHDREFFVEQRMRAPRSARPKRERKPRAAAGGDAGAAAPAEPKPSNKVRVGGLAAGTEESTVESAAAAHGTVSRVKIIDSEVSGLHAIVTFANAEEADAAAAAMDGTALQGATVSASTTRPRARRTRKRGGAGAAAGAAGGDGKKAAGVADPARIWVGNLPAEIEADVVTAAFTKFGEVTRFQRRNPTARFCFLTFASADAAKAAVESGPIELDGEELTVQQSTATRVRADRVRNTRPNRRQVPQEQ